PKPDASQTNFANLDFLADASAVLTNLTANESGVVEIPLNALGPHQDLHVVAVDPLSTATRRLTLPEQKLTFLDLRLVQGLDPQQHFTMQKLIDVVPNGQEFVLRDVVTSKFEKYDSLARVYGLLTTLNSDSNFHEFSFLLTWPDLSDEEKQTLYSKYACHELSFFIYKKDPAFFTRVIEPYLQNKKDKTFIDRFLLNEDLSEFLLPWKYGQLNTFERILLARRIDGEQDKTARHLSDMLALIPPDIDHFNRLFDTAVKQSALEVGGTSSFETTLGLIIREEHERLLLTDEMAADMAMPAFSSAPGGSAGGYGGMGGGQGNRGAAPANLARQRAAGREMKEEAVERMDEFRKKAPQRRSLAAGSDRAENMLGEKAVEADGYFGDINVDGLEAIRQLYRQMDKTKEWAENNYYHLTIDQQNADLIPVSKFWTDYAAHNPAEPFVSTNLAEAARNFPDMVLALAVLDLPFKAAEHDVKFNEKQMTFTPTGPVVVFHEEIRPADAPDGNNKVLVSQNFYKNGERHRTELGEQVDNFVTDEFLIHTVYGCEVVITNPTSTRQKLSVLVQIPQGALPVAGSQTTRTFHIDVEPYYTQKLEYHFYFPAAADLAHFPVHIARNEKLIAAAEPFTFHVVQQPSKVDTNSWDYISQNGSLAEVVQFLETHNIHELNLDRIAWRMHDRNAFDTIIPLLAQRHVYSHTLWSYALLHNAAGPAREFLQHAQNVVNELGGRIQSSLVSIDPIERRTYQHLEYKPLVNARAHALGKRRQIVNDTLLGQYHQYMKELGYERALGDEELLSVTYYLLLQDRIEEALATFARVGRDNVATKMQYDYCKAYLAFFSDDPNQARAIAEKYTDHPVDRWRTTFQTIVAQLDEAGGGDAVALDEEDRTSQQDALAATEPTFEFQIDGKNLNVNYQNLDAVTVNFYEMDVELLFSRTPFVHQFGEDFTAIKPNHSVSVSLGKNKSQKSIPIPEQFHSRNVLVEVVSAGKAQSLPYFSNVLSVQVIENYGQVRVTHRDSRTPVSTCYVKVYAQLADGSVKFYKDGYTDIRGRFDYASLNTNQLDGATRFAILTLSEEHGAVVREALPPKR
ncbi:MAG: hypothetical protein KDA66_09990, partial [Planctomycetaceae bacterium]|nr:hypothetical protein [Planctomycetaceae bacterium]